MSDTEFEALIAKAKTEILSYYASKNEFIDYDVLKEKLGTDDEVFCKVLKALAETDEQGAQETESEGGCGCGCQCSGE
ncbi:Uncharacterised protein [Anaerobiospirillum thomasii]|uniref:Uncharacterized protein n=1 Tax=Anaerobiospirillum thomasii TaxID=179995 RepID=A0A2X0V479_9GAMM|nr:hypothetical protein [Anaerobiospirillum thomasii]SPT68558.1 Uncharacterised protein [Anaerobiospirillum thomasii]SPT68743.1 Uncharacterised protein [Anaerobiospirillum thomasii]